MTDFNASASHISMMQRPYGPRIHMDEAAAGGAPAAPAMPESFSSVAEAARFLTAERKQKEEAAARKPAKAAAAADEDTSDEGGADPGTEIFEEDSELLKELSDEDDDAALGKDPAPGDDDDLDGDPEEEELPPIKRPKSWGKEDQAEWEALSRSQQEKIAAREETREKAIRKAQNDAAETSKAHKAKADEAEQARTTFEEKARAALDVLAREQQRDYADIKTAADVSKLAATDPLRFVQWQAHQAEVAAIKDEVDKANKRKADKEAEDWKQFRNSESAKAIEHIPALADKEKAPKVMQKAVAALQDVGFTAKELTAFDNGEKLSLFDHRVQRLIFEAIRYRDIQAARTAQTKKAVPTVQRPGVKQPAGTASSERIKALTAKAHSSGSLRDFANLLSAERRASTRRAS